MRKYDSEKVRYLCPNCFEDTNIVIANDPTVLFNEIEDIIVDDNKASDIEGITDLYLTINGTCKCCGYSGTFIDIDSGMVEIIQELNKKGYMTTFCCEGHIKDEFNYDKAYVYFNVYSDDVDDIFYNNRILLIFPSQSWIINKYNGGRDENYSHYHKIEIYMKDEYAKNEEKRINALSHLKAFVNNLPNLKGE